MKIVLITGIVLALTCGMTFAQDRDRNRDSGDARPEKVDQALKERYGEDIQTEIVGRPTELNGVKVYRVKTTGKRGESTALITEHGDFLLSGMPSDFKGLPENVRATRELFKDEPRNAETFIADAYYIDVQQAKNKLYRLQFDAVGRLREIANPEEVERFETRNFKPADNTVAGKVQELAERQIPRGSKIDQVYIDPRLEGFYVAKYNAPRGGEILVILDEQGNIFQTRTEIDRNELAPPVRAAFERMFDPSKIKYTYRSQYQFYQFQQPTEDGRVTFKVRPNGEIMGIQNVEAAREDEAVTARFREGDDSRDADPRDREHGPQPERRRDR